MKPSRQKNIEINNAVVAIKIVTKIVFNQLLSSSCLRILNHDVLRVQGDSAKGLHTKCPLVMLNKDLSHLSVSLASLSQ